MLDNDSGTTAQTGVSDTRRQMVANMFTAIDEKDVDGFLNHMAPDAVQRFGNGEPLRGHAEMRVGNAAFIDSLASMHHEVLSLWESDDGVVCRLRVTYGRLDGTAVTLPGVTIFREEDGLISEYLVFFDVAPVFAIAEPGVPDALLGT
jgi:ketosteroid isomerase-like protein